jgi:hypothetical protein
MDKVQKKESSHIIPSPKTLREDSEKLPVLSVNMT